MKRAPVSYRRCPWDKQTLERIREIERKFHVSEFGEELARVNLEMTLKERLQYLKWMRGQCKV